jgi:predicted nuclease with TOPRIM domain
MAASTQPPESFEQQVLAQLERLQQNDERLSQDLGQLRQEFGQLGQEFEKLSQDVGRFSERFGDYQKATQWVVQLAFTLIASATLTVIITTVLR